jgi:hypothetical protein
MGAGVPLGVMAVLPATGVGTGLGVHNAGARAAPSSGSM